MYMLKQLLFLIIKLHQSEKRKIDIIAESIEGGYFTFMTLLRIIFVLPFFSEILVFLSFEILV